MLTEIFLNYLQKNERHRVSNEKHSVVPSLSLEPAKVGRFCYSKKVVIFLKTLFAWKFFSKQSLTSTM